MYTVVRITNYGFAFDGSENNRMAMIFRNETDAINWLQRDWENCFNAWLGDLRTDIEKDLTYHEDDYAVIYGKDGDYVEWFLIQADEYLAF